MAITGDVETVPDWDGELTISDSSTDLEEETTSNVFIGYTMKVHAEPGINSEVVGVLPAYTGVDAFELVIYTSGYMIGEQWVCIPFEGGDAWISGGLVSFSGDFTTLEKAAPADEGTEIPDAIVTLQALAATDQYAKRLNSLYMMTLREVPRGITEYSSPDAPIRYFDSTERTPNPLTANLEVQQRLLAGIAAIIMDVNVNDTGILDSYLGYVQSGQFPDNIATALAAHQLEFPAIDGGTETTNALDICLGRTPLSLAQVQRNSFRDGNRGLAWVNRADWNNIEWNQGSGHSTVMIEGSLTTLIYYQMVSRVTGNLSSELEYVCNFNFATRRMNCQLVEKEGENKDTRPGYVLEFDFISSSLARSLNLQEDKLKSDSPLGLWIMAPVWTGNGGQ